MSSLERWTIDKWAVNLNEWHPDKTNRRLLVLGKNIFNGNVEKLGYKVVIDPTKNYILKSDTGTGKTTIVKDYIFNNQHIKH